jgi:membrane protease subunit (stomatin/prohibitin family)
MAGFGLFYLIFGICIAVAPLIIWRNTNRTNRLLAIIAVQLGAAEEDVRTAWDSGGGAIPRVTGLKNGGILGALAGFRDNYRQAMAEQNTEDSQDSQPASAAPTARFCAACGADDIPLDVATCPKCTRILPENPMFCPRCGHEITHKPAFCPGCGGKFRYKDKPAESTS